MSVRAFGLQVFDQCLFDNLVGGWTCDEVVILECVCLAQLADTESSL